MLPLTVDRGRRGSDLDDGNDRSGRDSLLCSEGIARLVSDLPSGEVKGRTDHGEPPSHAGSCASLVDLEAVRSLASGPSPRPSLATVHALQEWEGYVSSVGSAAFEARLLDVTGGARYEAETATIPLDDLSPRDRERLTEGSVFRWVIGYESSPGGTRKRVSQIVFRDLPVVTRSDVRAGRDWASSMKDNLGP